jgi:hypothetical protein
LLLGAIALGGCLHPPREVIAETRVAAEGEPNHYGPAAGAPELRAEATCAAPARC